MKEKEKEKQNELFFFSFNFSNFCFFFCCKDVDTTTIDEIELNSEEFSFHESDSYDQNKLLKKRTQRKI